MSRISIPKTISVKDPDFFLDKEEGKGFDALSYLQEFLDKMCSTSSNTEAISIEGDKLTSYSNCRDAFTFTGLGVFGLGVCTSIAQQIENSAALSTANKIFSLTSSCIFGAVYGTEAIRYAYQLAKSQNFSDLLKKEDDQALQHLIQELCQPISSNLDQLKSSWSRLDPQLQESKKQKFKQKLQETARERFCLDQNEEIVKHLQEPLDGMESLLGLKDQEYWQLNPLEAIGLIVTQQKIKQRNWTQLKGLTNPEVAKAVDRAYRRGLLERVNSSNPAVKEVAKDQVKSLIGRVRVASSQTRKIHTALLVINLLGAIISIVGVLTLPLGIGIAITAISCLITASSVGLSMYLSKEALLESPPSKHYKTLIIIYAVILGLSLAIFTGITLGFGLSLVQLGVALGLGGLLGGGYLGYHYYLLSKKDQLWKESHPSVEIFQKMINEKKLAGKGWDKEVHNVFKKLPKDLRQKIRQKYEVDSRFDQYTLTNEISAFKKTSKHFWQRWQISGLEEDRIVALEVQAVYDGLLLSRQYAKHLRKLGVKGDSITRKKYIEKYNNNNTLLEKAKNCISNRKQVQEQLQKDLRYILARKNSLSRLAKDIEIASKQLLPHT